MKIMYWNINQDDREESHELTCWNYRKARIFNILKENDADVYLLLEVKEENIKELRKEFPDYHIYEGDDQKGKWKMVVMSRIFSCFVSYPLKGTNKRLGYLDFETFRLGLVHFPLSEEDKDSCIDSIKLLLEILKNKDKDFVLCGDFNLFFDLDGEKQLTRLKEIFKDSTYPLRSFKGKEYSGTFIGFPQNDHKKTEETMSSLDRCFTTGEPFQVNTIDHEFSFDNSDFREDFFPSDHMPLIFNCEYDD